MRNRKVWLFLMPSMAGVFLFILLPFADVFRRSFTGALGNRFMGFENYRQVLENQSFRLAAFNTFRFLAVCIPLLLILSFFIALLVYRNDLKNGLFKTTLVLPMAIPIASIVLLWRIVFDREGLLNQFLALFGVEGKEWIYKSSAFQVLVATYIWKNLGYQMLLWLAGLSGISESLYEAAKVDGAGFFAQLWYITLPGLKGTGAMALLLAVINSFKVFREVYLIAGSYPHESIYMLQHLFNNWFLNLDVQKMSAAAVMLTIVIAFPVLWGNVRRRKGDTV